MDNRHYTCCTQLKWEVYLNPYTYNYFVTILDRGLFLCLFFDFLSNLYRACLGLEREGFQRFPREPTQLEKWKDEKT